MVWKADNAQCNEAGKIIWELVPYTRGFGLDLGCGPNKGFPHFVGVDNRKDERLFNIKCNPDITIEDASKLPFGDASCDFVFSSHLLEHIEDFKGALAEWWRVVKVGGHLVMYLPHKDFYPNIGTNGANPDHKHDFLPSDIVEAMKNIGSWDIVRNEDRSADDEYSFFIVFKKEATGHKYSYLDPKPEKTCAIVRYGAWGDALQMSSVLPGLKKQGFHITLYTTPRAWEVVKEDPNINAVIMQDTDQVPNQALGAFWGHEKKKYDRWINLSESVEGTWLTLSSAISHSWPKAVRDKRFDGNYVEFQHELSGVPYPKPYVKFYTTLEEQNWVADKKTELDASPLILWVLNGSSVHKVWPHIDQIFARVLTCFPKAKIVTIGDAKSMMLVEPWRNEPRIVACSGKEEWTIRRTLAFAQQCDLVIGPETGVLSGVSMEKLPKILFLSHSSHNNLSRDWTNTFALFSTKTKCFPCHQMHYNWDNCVKNEDKKADGTDEVWAGTAQCQVDIPPQACWEAILRALKVKESSEVTQRVATA